MHIRQHSKVVAQFLIIVVILVLPCSNVLAQFYPPLSSDQQKQFRADALRRQAATAARQHLGYPEIYQDQESSSTPQDFSAIGNQLQRLQPYLPPPPPSALPLYQLRYPGWQSVETLYGSYPLNVDALQKFIQKRLSAQPSPHLQLATIEDRGDYLLVKFSDAAGRPVQVYSVNKMNGLWTRIP